VDDGAHRQCWWRRGEEMKKMPELAPPAAGTDGRASAPLVPNVATDGRDRPSLPFTRSEKQPPPRLELGTCGLQNRCSAG
jgi:hypothetical protein